MNNDKLQTFAKSFDSLHLATYPPYLTTDPMQTTQLTTYTILTNGHRDIIKGPPKTSKQEEKPNNNIIISNSSHMLMPPG